MAGLTGNQAAIISIVVCVATLASLALVTHCILTKHVCQMNCKQNTMSWSFTQPGACLCRLNPLQGRIIDGITDPITGVITDRTRTRWGRRRPCVHGTAHLLLHILTDDLRLRAGLIQAETQVQNDTGGADPK